MICPTCGGALRLEWRLVSTGGGLSGSQLKVAVRDTPFLVCDCGFTEQGREARGL